MAVYICNCISFLHLFTFLLFHSLIEKASKCILHSNINVIFMFIVQLIDRFLFVDWQTFSNSFICLMGARYVKWFRRRKKLGNILSLLASQSVIAIVFASNNPIVVSVCIVCSANCKEQSIDINFVCEFISFSNSWCISLAAVHSLALCTISVRFIENVPINGGLYSIRSRRNNKNNPLDIHIPPSVPKL